MDVQKSGIEVSLWEFGSIDRFLNLNSKPTKGHPKISFLDLEATTGFEPVDIGFANQSLKPLGYVAKS